MAMTISFLEMPNTRLRGILGGGRPTCSRYTIKKIVPPPETKRRPNKVSRRREPGQFRILGGQPFLPSDVYQITLPNVEKYERPATHPPV
jgi:hypothetical protein